MSALERGERKRPYPPTVRALADALGLPEDERASLFALEPRRGAEEPALPTGPPELIPPVPPTPLVGREREVRGNLAEAATLHEESLDLFRALEDWAGIATMLSNLGAVAEGEGEYEKAAAFYQESLDLYRQLGEKRDIALLTSRLARISSIEADYARAALYDESLRLQRELGDRRGISQDLEGIAAMLAARGHTEAAVRLWAAVEALREGIGAPPNDIERARYEPLVATTRQALGEETFADMWAEGRNRTPEQALDAW